MSIRIVVLVYYVFEVSHALSNQIPLIILLSFSPLNIMDIFNLLFATLRLITLVFVF